MFEMDEQAQAKADDGFAQFAMYEFIRAHRCNPWQKITPS